MTAKTRTYTWNPKNLGKRQANNGPHQNEVWLYLRGRTLDVVIQTDLHGKVLGQTVYRVRLPAAASRLSAPREIKND